MICEVCEKQVNLCKCADIDDRMKIMANSSNNSILWATCCDKHYQRCKCEHPKFMLSNEILKEK